MAQHRSVDVQVLYEQIAWPLYKKFPLENESDDEKKVEYMHCFDVFKMAINDASVFADLDIPEEMKLDLMKNIRHRLTPQPIKIRADIEVTCYTYEGIDAIREALTAGQNIGTEEIPVKVKLIAPPMYVMTTNTLDKPKGIQMLKDAIEVIRTEILKRDGTMCIKMEPKVVSVVEERELSLMMEKLEMDARQVDGDAAEDD